MLEKRLTNSPEFWALVDFLAENGVLDREKFKEFLLRRLEEYVDIVTQVHVEQAD